MKKRTALIFALVCVLCFAGCSDGEEKVWDWAQSLNREDITSATPWSQDSMFDALDDQDTLELVQLLNELTRDSFTENKHLSGGTPAFGIEIKTAAETCHINEYNGPASLEIRYHEKQWLINSPELLDYIRNVSAPTE